MLCRFVSDPSFVLYPFGYGLSYSSFAYSDLALLKNEENGCVNVGTEPAFCFRVTVTNSGSAAGEHSVPLFLSHELARVSVQERVPVLLSDSLMKCLPASRGCWLQSDHCCSCHMSWHG